MHTDWRCDTHGMVLPLHVAAHINAGVVDAAAAHAAVPMWCPWPPLPGWVVTGVAWAGDERHGGRATAVACSGPAPLGGGPADIILVAEEPGVGLGARFAGLAGPDPGPVLSEVMTAGAAHARIRVGGHPTALWSVPGEDDRSAYVGEARGVWLYAVAFPAAAGYLFAEHVVLHDLVESVPSELVYGAPSPYLHGRA